MMFAVNHWGSKPGTNDDCHDGSDFQTLGEAQAAYQTAPPAYVAWVELDGPGVHCERKNPAYKPTRDDLDDWRREIAQQAGMGLGVEAYNDHMGW